MLTRFWKMLDVEEGETGRVGLLLIMSFLMGLFLATVAVASQSLLLGLSEFNEKVELPYVLLYSGGFGIVITVIYNFLQGRISFSSLAIFNLLMVVGLTAFMEFGKSLVNNVKIFYTFGFALILPFTFVVQLVFWGAFGRMFNVRDGKRLIGSVDVGTDIASIIAFFSIPVLLASGIKVEYLYTIGLASIIGYLIFFVILSVNYLGKGKLAQEESEIKKLSIGQFLSNKYILLMAAFIVVSLTSLRFVDYSFYNVSVVQFDNDSLPIFLSLFEATIVIFSFLFTTFITDRIAQDYGLGFAMIINPIVIALFTVAAFLLGSFFGFDPLISGKTAVVYFFIAIAMSKLFINSLRDALDTPIFKFYYVPIDKSIKIDVQTKIEGFVFALASTIAGALIVAINQFQFFNLLSISAFTAGLLVIWYFVSKRMYHGYRDTLQGSLMKNKKAVEKDVVKEYTLDTVLDKEVKSDAETKVIYGLKLMEKLEPALFESSVISLSESKIKRVRQFALDKIQELGIAPEEQTETKGLAVQAAGSVEDSDLLSISPDKLMKLSKSVKQTDRVLAAKFMRKLTNNKTIFILLELMRDPDPRVRSEAILTARKVKRPETWNVLIEMLSSPLYSHQAASALKETGPAVLQHLETAFHKSGQGELVMAKLIQIMGHIGGDEGLQLLWKKIDYPDKRIVKQILYALRFINYKATGREALAVKELLDTEMSKTLWNIAALDEIPDEPIYSFLREALNEEIRDNYDHITLLLSLLYDPGSVQLVKENVEAGTPDSIQYALELLDLFVDQDLKPKLIPLLDDSPTANKLEQLQIYFPRESYNPIQTINYILNRDFNYNNRWTKACAVHSTAYIDSFRVSRGLISQMFNQDKLLQETTAWVVFNKDKQAYYTVSDRLPYRDKKFLDSAIENNQLLDGLDDGFFLFIEMVMHIKRLPAFERISGKVLSDLSDKIMPVTLNTRDKLMINSTETPILIVASGEVKLKKESEEIGVLKKDDVFGDLFQEGPVPKVTEVEATERSVLFKIELIDFYFVLASHHDLAQGLIYNVTERKKILV
ncbi:MAG: HEAT repeat domain-containing protein [Bacteroidetes bacterium]|nr:HEAT repeat domain-containing protein [Bacteroidota bacterium]